MKAGLIDLMVIFSLAGFTMTIIGQAFIYASLKKLVADLSLDRGF